MLERGPLHQVRNPIPSEVNQDIVFPIGYTPLQLIGAWTWQTNKGEFGDDQAGYSFYYF